MAAENTATNSSANSTANASSAKAKDAPSNDLPPTPTAGAVPSAAATLPTPSLLAAPASNAEAAKPEALDDRVQNVKIDVIKLNRDLLVLEEELLFPANTQVVLFLSMDVGKMFELDSVQVKIDDKLIASYLYTPLEVKALHRGGVQRLYLGNLRAGEHELVAFFTGGGPHTRDYKRGATIKFTKEAQAKYLELRIRDSSNKLQPEFDIKTWQ
ncbi:MAG: AraC family transcriptional regulator [Burkholderiaceae bacterium]|nr:AraC family transcriptional regulator [Burkholderiaceae bacterium]